MKKSIFSIILTVVIVCESLCSFTLPTEEHQTLEVGSPAPNFKLPGVDDKIYTLASFKMPPF